MACLTLKARSKPRGLCAKHFQQKCEAVLRWTMRGKKAFPAKVRSGFALDNAWKESISSKSAKRFCVGQCVERKHFQQEREAVLCRTMRLKDSPPLASRQPPNVESARSEYHIETCP